MIAKRSLCGFWIVCLLLLFSCSDEETAGPADTGTFIKLFGGANADIASSALPTADDGFILLGTTEIENEGEASFKIKLIKLDKNGNTQWQKLYPSFEDSNGSDEIPQTSYKGSSLIVNEKGYLIIGDCIYDNATSGLLLLQTDLSGNEVMKNSITITEGEDTVSMHGVDLLVNNNQELKVTGQIESDSENIYIGTVNPLDLSVNPECTFRYSSAGANPSVVKSIEIEDNGDVVCAVSVRLTADNSRLIRVPACQGAELTGPLISSPNNNQAFRVSQISSAVAGYAMIGTTDINSNDDIFLAKVNDYGVVQYLKTYTEITGIRMSEDELGLAITNTSDGGFVFGGSTQSSTGGETDIIIVKTDAFGNVEWSKRFGDQNEEYASFIREMSDGGYLIFGNTEFGGIDTMILIKTDENGDIE